jgi:hypothetical protein
VPDGCSAALTCALAAAEASLLAAHALATPSTVAALPADGRALLRRVGALSAELCAVDDATAPQQAAPSGADGGSGVSRERPHFEFSSLPHSLVVRVLAALPADARLRCAEVCRTWRAAVLDRSLWLRVNLSAGSGLTHEVTPALLRAVSARAAGRMQALMLPVSELDPDFIALLDLAQANSASLRELEMVQPDEERVTHSTFAEVERVLRAAPQLQVLRTEVAVTRTHIALPLREAVRMLRNESPFGPLHVRSLLIEPNVGDDDEQAQRFNVPELLAFLAAMSEHASLEKAFLEYVPLDAPAVLDALIDAALARRLSELNFTCCNLSSASIPAFLRLLGGGAVTQLVIDGGRRLLDAPAALLLADALRANTTLRILQLDDVFIWDDMVAGVAVMTALTAHPSLHLLNLINNRVHVGNAAAVGAALGALVAASTPALHTLYVPFCALGDVGLAPLVDALPRSTHLRELYCKGNAMSDEFARDNFLPAIRANTSLRMLEASDKDIINVPDEVHEAEALVKARANADAAAVGAAA